MTAPLGEVPPRVLPIYAAGLFKLSLDEGLSSTIVYVYHDVDCYYYELVSRGGRQLDEEIELLRTNFQAFLDEEQVVINGKELKGACVHVEVVAPTCSPVMVFFYNRMGGNLRKGLNRYSNRYEPETAEYPYHFVWWLPKKAIVREAFFCENVEVEVKGNVVIGRVKAGQRLCGEEFLVFEL